MDHGVAVADIALDFDLLRPGSMADIADRHSILLGPEEWRRIERRLLPQHVRRRDLALPLGDRPMLDPRRLCGEWVGVRRDIAGRVNAGRAGFEEAVDEDAIADGQARRLRQLGARTDADADQNEAGVELLPVGYADLPPVKAQRRSAEVEPDTIFLVQAPEELAELAAEGFLERHLFGRDDVDLDAAFAQRSRRFERDEARADHHRARAGQRLFGDRPRVAE